MNNKLEVIGIDHGWSMMKTVTQVFVTGVKEITTTPALFGDVLEYDGKYYKIGTVRQEVKDTKVEDDSFYLLTLAAVAKELKKRGLSDAKVFLAVGLPLTRFVVQFAFRSGSKEDTISLIEALAHSTDKVQSEEIMVTYRSKYDIKPAWVEQVENLLVALEMYRIEEEKAISHLSDILTAYGIDVSAEEIRSTKAEEIRTTIREKAEVR